jgi:hypothetical protein
MKLRYKLLLILILVAPALATAQCDNSLIDSCKNRLNETVYLKHFKVRFAKANNNKRASVANFSVYLNKGNIYQFTTANDKTKDGKAIIKLYDDFRYYGGNINTKTKEISRSFGLLCQKTGVYYLTIKFQDNDEGCSAIMLSVKEKKKKYDWEKE